ncbi:adenylyl-sulfate kinase [Haloarcula montana]|uniref:adenylyl-sulfate kinase n=1 Tax=Haloarcula montana TaxID=3111776 RepID=UPI002D7A1741|nr:adenylyl-sulfate kinase [Haloarcula sp. GH36]
MSFTLWFMGLPAAGKSTLAKRTEQRLRDHDYLVENLDGDEVRTNLHPDLGFSKQDRATNNRRTAYICSLLNRNDITVVTGMITPFRESQQEARKIVEENGEFVLIYVKCSVETCAERDPKDLYEQAREGKIENFTGVNHPFQEPHNPDIVVNTEVEGIDASVHHLWERLQELGILQSPAEEYEFRISRDEEEKIKERLRDIDHIHM